MTYRINKTDGNQLVDIPDGTFDTSSTSLTLIGKNVTNFGEAINENLVKLLENFASSSAPEQAIIGQMWYDTSTGRLNVYDGTSFRTAGGPVVSPDVPTDLITGDLWINNQSNQLYMYDGSDLVLVGPGYTNDQGTTGITVESVLDTFNRTQVIGKLFVSNVLIGILSKTQFTPAQPITGYSDTDPLRVVKIGFNVGSLSTIKFDVTSTRADGIVTDTGEVKSATQIVYNDEDGTIVGSLTLQSDDGITLGATEDIKQTIQAGKFVIEHQNTSQDIGIRVKSPTGTREAITINAENSRVGIFTETPASMLDVAGDMRVQGDLIVGGDAVTINVSNIQVEDKTIELGATTTSPTDTGADGGGIILKGTSDKSITWVKQVLPEDGYWTSTENFNLGNDRVYKIGAQPVLSATTLGAGVTSSSLTSLGNLLELNMDNGLNIVENSISYPAGDIVLAPGFSGTVDVSDKRISNVATPIDLQDATNKTYVDTAVYLRGISMSMDVTGLTNTDIATQLDTIAPFYDPNTAPNGVAVNGTLLRLHATTTSVTNANIDYSPNEGDEFTRITVTTPTGTDSAVRDIATGQVILAPAATVTVTRVNKLFTMTAGHWIYTGTLA
jgi:hypothetical protein